MLEDIVDKVTSDDSSEKDSIENAHDASHKLGQFFNEVVDLLGKEYDVPEENLDKIKLYSSSAVLELMSGLREDWEERTIKEFVDQQDEGTVDDRGPANEKEDREDEDISPVASQVSVQQLIAIADSAHDILGADRAKHFDIDIQAVQTSDVSMYIPKTIYKEERDGTIVKMYPDKEIEEWENKALDLPLVIGVQFIPTDAEDSRSFLSLDLDIEV